MHVILCKKAIFIICDALWVKCSLFHLHIVHLKLYSTYSLPAYLMSSVLCPHIDNKTGTVSRTDLDSLNVFEKHSNQLKIHCKETRKWLNSFFFEKIMS